MEKTEIRKKILRARKRLSREDMIKKSAAIHEKFLRLQPYIKARMIMTYVSFGKEVDTVGLLGRMFRDDKKICVPDCHRDPPDMVAIRISSEEDLLEPKRDFVIREPSMTSREMISPDKIDIIIVPIVAFDEGGGRIGYGKGYYDRFLSGLDRDRIFGLAFDFQEVDVFEKGPHDIRIPNIITESRIVVSA